MMDIIVDTREKNPWQFSFYDVNKKVQKLDCGDYTTEKLKDIIAIERKATTAEIAGNLGSKKHRERFHREFERMKDLKRGYVICEFSEFDVYDYPKNTELDHTIASMKKKLETAQSEKQIRFLEAKLSELENKFSQIRINGKYLRKLIGDIERGYDNVVVIFKDNKNQAEETAYEIFESWEISLG